MRFPSIDDIEDYVDFHGFVTNSNPDLHNLPNFIKIQKNKRKSLALISSDDDALKKILPYFPLAHFKL